MPGGPSWSGSRSNRRAPPPTPPRSAREGVLRLGGAMPAPSEQQVLTALATIVDPDLGRDVVSLGMIKDLSISSAGEVGFTFELTTPACPVRDRFKTQAEEA